MTLRIRSLVSKIFLWFWATVIVTGIAMVITFHLQSTGTWPQWHTNLAETARYFGTATVEEAERHGTPAASAYIELFERRTHLRACLFDAAGSEIAGSNCEPFAETILKVRSTHSSSVLMKGDISRIVMPLAGNGGSTYIYATELPAGPLATSNFSRSAIVLRSCVALLVSFCVCYLLVRYLTAPILRLREASQHLAAGDLSTRAAAGMESRHDELGSLVRDFNAMASRIEELVSRQRQLIYDISHELRSPLARLTVALDLGRERKGNDAAFDRMEQDIECMGEMIGRLLTVAKLDTSSAPVQMTRLDLGELVAQIVRGAEFELRERDDAVRLTVRGYCIVHGNAELLQSAIENIIRNAVRYTTPGNSVDVHLERLDTADTLCIRLAVRDYGQGVPEAELLNIFQPFYRVANDRDRQSGGTGLGLAIADRVVRIHGGTIRAQNASPCGLEVEILLPAGS